MKKMGKPKMRPKKTLPKMKLLSGLIIVPNSRLDYTKNFGIINPMN